MCLLSVGISEAAVERSFSMQKFTHSDIRNRLSEDIVEAEMRIKFNREIEPKYTKKRKFQETLRHNPDSATLSDVESELSE